MSNWPDLEFVQPMEEHLPSPRTEERTGWEEIVFEIVDEEVSD
jgi:hypothetical protein